MDAASLVVGFLAGCFFSLVLSTFLAKKVGQAVFNALKDYDKYQKEEHERYDDHNDADWWKKG